MEEKLFKVLDKYYEGRTLSYEEVHLLFFGFPVDEFKEYLEKYQNSDRFKKINRVCPM